MSETSREEILKKQNRRYRETIIIIVCSIIAFLAGIVFDREMTRRAMEQSAKLGGIVVEGVPYAMKQMVSHNSLQGGVTVTMSDKQTVKK